MQEVLFPPLAITGFQHPYKAEESNTISQNKTFKIIRDELSLIKKSFSKT